MNAGGNQYQMLHLGIEETQAPTRLVRTKQTTACFLACIGGRGRVLVDGCWRLCAEGFACLLPTHTLNAFEAMPKVRWEFWVCYQRPTEMLASSGLTIEAISQEVGYQNPFVFSNAFTKWIGWRPSEYRRKKFNKA